MSVATFKLYERIIDRKRKDLPNAYTRERITELVNDAHAKGKLTDEEFENLCNQITEAYGVLE